MWLPKKPFLQLLCHLKKPRGITQARSVSPDTSSKQYVCTVSESEPLIAQMLKPMLYRLSSISLPYLSSSLASSLSTALGGECILQQ